MCNKNNHQRATKSILADVLMKKIIKRHLSELDTIRPIGGRNRICDGIATWAMPNGSIRTYLWYEQRLPDGRYTSRIVYE